jgi:hypothetical protein
LDYLDKIALFCCYSDLEVMLQSSDFEKPPENSEMSAHFQKQLEECATGSVAFVYEEKGEAALHLFPVRIRIQAFPE